MSMKVTPARPVWTSLTAAWTVTVCPTCALTSAGAIVCARAGSAATIKPRAKMSVRIAVSPCHNANGPTGTYHEHGRKATAIDWGMAGCRGCRRPVDRQSAEARHDHALLL